MFVLQIQTFNFFTVFKKMNIRYFNPFRLTDPFRRPDMYIKSLKGTLPGPEEKPIPCPWTNSYSLPRYI